MVLNTNGGLFPNPGLLNDIGTLKERWQQEGSQIVNILGDNVDHEVIYSVPAGYRLFISSAVMDWVVADTNVQLRDNGEGGTRKCDFHIIANDPTWTITFDTPLFFDDDVYVYCGSSVDIDISLTGWIEKLQ